MQFSLFGRGHVPALIPKAWIVTSTVLSAITLLVLVICLTRRVLATKDWTRVPLTRWLTFAIYIDSILFVTATIILKHGFGLDKTPRNCDAAIYLCLFFYLTSKILIYYLLVEKVYIIKKVKTSRIESKLYLFNFAMLVIYCGIAVLNFVYRIARFNKKGVCIIGMELKELLPLIIFDAVVNFYLTLLFVIPLRNLYSYKNCTNSNLRTITLRSFVGCLGTLTSSVVNLTVLLVLRGEAAWICLLLCNADVLFSVLVLHWVTSKDSSSTSPACSISRPSLGRLRAFSSYGRHIHTGNSAGTVTTSITSAKRRDGDQDNLESGGIMVHFGHVVEIEHESEKDGGRRSHKSTEDLVGRVV